MNPTHPSARARSSAAAVTILLVLLTLAALYAPASARSLPSTRKGVDLWFEVPKVGIGLGDAYSGEHNIETGWGFGFGGIFGLTDNIAIVGRVGQTNHTVDATDRMWDLDHRMVGLRYTLFADGRWQPFVSLGYVHQNLEFDQGDDIAGDFQRLTGDGFFGSLGVDYFWSARLFFNVHVDYTLVGYDEGLDGIEPVDFDDPLDGDSATVSLGIGYRIPTW